MKLIPDAMAQDASPAPNASPAQGAPSAPAPSAPTPPVPTPPASPAAPTPPTGTHTGTAADGSPDQPQPPTLPELLTQLVPLFVVMGIVYALVIRPRARKEKEQLAQLRNVRRGDMLVTTSGFLVRVTRSIDDDEVEVELAPNMRVRMLRTAIAEVRSRGEPVKDEPPAKPAEAKPAPAKTGESKTAGRSGGGKTGGAKANGSKTPPQS